MFLYLAAAGLSYSMWALLAVAYNLYLSKLQEILEDREACMLQSTGSRRVGHNFFTEQQKQHANP